MNRLLNPGDGAWVDAGSVALGGVADGVVEEACGSIPVEIGADGGCGGHIHYRNQLFCRLPWRTAKA